MPEISRPTRRPLTAGRRLAAALVLAALVVVTCAREAAAGAGWSPGSAMSTPRWGGTATLLNDGRVLVAGGLRDNFVSYLSTAEIYEPRTNSWSPTGPMGAPRFNHRAVLLPSGDVLVAGGYSAGAPGGVTRNTTAEIYNPATNQWSNAGNPVPRDGHSLTLLPDGRALMVGGNGSNAGTPPLVSAQIYNPATGGWTNGPNLPTGLWNHVAALLPSGKVLVTGGFSASGPSRATYVFDPASPAAWGRVGDLSTGRESPGLAELSNGKLLIIGGNNATGVLASSEIFDPATGAFTPGPAMATPRRWVSNASLQSRRVLVSGGVGSSGGHVESAELFDPDANAWTAAAARPRIGWQAAIATLRDGRVLVAGGDNGGQVFSATDIYTAPTAARVSQIDFRGALVGSAQTQPAAVVNTGQDPLFVTRVTVRGPDGGDFTITGDGCTQKPVAPGGHCSIDVRFTPTEGGPRLATLSVESNSASGTDTAAITGFGTSSSGVAPPSTVSATPSTTSAANASTTPRKPTVERVGAVVTATWDAHKRYTVFTSLYVTGVPRGAKVELRCRGGRQCPVNRQTATIKRGTSNMMRLVKNRRFTVGTALEVSILKPNAIGKVVRLVVRPGRRPRWERLCLPPGAEQPSRCPR